MKKVSKILFLIHAILSFVEGAAFLIAGIGVAIVGAVKSGEIIQWIQQKATEGGGSLPPELNQELIIAVAVIAGVLIALVSILSFTSGGLAVLASKAGTTGLAIANIVLGLFTCMLFGIVAGVLCIIANGKEKRKAKVAFEEEPKKEE